MTDIAISITDTTVLCRGGKRVDDRRNKRYCHEFGVSFIYTYTYDESLISKSDAARAATKIANFAAQSVSKRQDEHSRGRLTDILSSLMAFYSSVFDVDPVDAEHERDVHGSTYTRGDVHQLYVAFNFVMFWEKPSLLPSKEEFMTHREALSQALLPEARRVLEDGMAAFREEQQVEKAVEDARWLIDAVRDEANKRAREACRFDQRLAALEAEYSAEFALQVDKIMDTESEWESALEHGASEYAVEYVREQRSTIRAANKLGLIRGASLNGSLNHKDAEAIKAFVAARRDQDN